MSQTGPLGDIGPMITSSSASASKLGGTSMPSARSVSRDDRSRVLPVEPVGQHSPNGLHIGMNVLKDVARVCANYLNIFAFIICKTILSFNKPAEEEHRLQTTAEEPSVVVLRREDVGAGRPADHEGGPRHRAEELLEVYRIDEAKAAPAPLSIAVVDDVLTNGTHFRAMKTILKDCFRAVSVVGLFIARRVFPNHVEDFEDDPV